MTTSTTTQKGGYQRAHVGRAVVVVMQPVPAAMREEADPEQHRGLVIGAEEPNREERAGGRTWTAMADGRPSATPKPKYTQPTPASCAPR